MQRRRVLQTIAAGTTLWVAGCSGSGDESDGGSETPPNGSDGGSDTPPNGSDGGSDAPPDGSDGGSDAPPDGSDGGSDTPTLGNLDVAFENNYRFSVTVPQMAEAITGAFNGGNFYSVVPADGDTVTTYLIDGNTYVVADGSCTQVPGGAAGGVDVGSLADADTVEQDVTGSEATSLVPSGTATIDGAQMYVYELESAATYYIGVDSRRLRRVETQGTVIDYTDWGEVAPITAPC